MVDFIRIRFSEEPRLRLISQIHNLQNLPAIAIRKRGITSLVQNHDAINFTIEDFPIRTAIQGLDISITRMNTYIQNSLHHTYNIWQEGRKYNSNDFSYSHLVETLNYLQSMLPAIILGDITTLEFGFNLKTEISPSTIIKENLLLHDVKGPGRTQSYRGSGLIKVFPKANYDIKAYDKGRQDSGRSTQNAKVLRLEIRFRSKELKLLGVSNTEDLKRKQTLRKMFLKLLKRFEELVIVDNFNTAMVAEPDQSKLFRYTNVSYWNSVKNRQTKSRHKRHFNALLITNDLLKTKNLLRQELLAKYLHLINR